MSLTAIGVGMAALAVIGGGLGIGFATSSAVKAIAQQPEAHGKIRSTLLIGAALAEATAIYGFVSSTSRNFYTSIQKTSRCA
ncbi:ATP synthase F0 subunit C, partial [Holdemanella biformis]